MCAPMLKHGPADSDRPTRTGREAAKGQNMRTLPFIVLAADGLLGAACSSAPQPQPSPLPEQAAAVTPPSQAHVPRRPPPRPLPNPPQR